MARYEVTLEDGYKARVNASSAGEACSKVESMPIAKGAKAISSVRVDERETLKARC